MHEIVDSAKKSKIYLENESDGMIDDDFCSCFNHNFDNKSP